jgi:hypothetical protein
LLCFLFLFLFFLFFLYCDEWGTLCIHTGSYNVSNISYTNSPPQAFSFIPCSPRSRLFLLFIYFFVHLFTCAYIVWVIALPCPPPLLFPPPSVLGRSRSALTTDFVEEKTYA